MTTAPVPNFEPSKESLPPLPEKLTTKQVAELLKVDLTLLKYWLRTLQPNIPKDDRTKAFKWDAKALEAMHIIKQLREEDRGMETIRRVIREREDLAHLLPDAGSTGSAPDVQLPELLDEKIAPMLLKGFEYLVQHLPDDEVLVARVDEKLTPIIEKTTRAIAAAQEQQTQQALQYTASQEKMYEALMALKSLHDTNVDLAERGAVVATQLEEARRLLAEKDQQLLQLAPPRRRLNLVQKLVAGLARAVKLPGYDKTE